MLSLRRLKLQGALSLGKCSIAPFPKVLSRYLSTPDGNIKKSSYKDILKKYGMTATIVYSVSYLSVLATMFIAVDTNIATLISPSFDYASSLETVPSLYYALLILQF